MKPQMGHFLQDLYGFVPAVFQAQSPLPRLIEAETGLAATVAAEGALSRVRKESILLADAAARRNRYCVALHYQNLCVLGAPDHQLEAIAAGHRQAVLPPADVALLDFGAKPGAAGRRACLAHGWTQECLLEAAFTAAWGAFLCSLSTGLAVQPDFEPPELVPADPGDSNPLAEEAGVPLSLLEDPPDDPSFDLFRREYGLVPAFFRAQAARPDLLQAEAAAVRIILFTKDVLDRDRKERIVAAVSEANQNTYWTTLQAHALSSRRAAFESEADQSLIALAAKLARQPKDLRPEDRNALCRAGLTAPQIFEAIATASLANFLNTLACGLGVAPDFEPRPEPRKIVHLPAAQTRLIGDSAATGPDAGLVESARAGDLDAFEQLITQHSRLVYRTLVAILGNTDEARDAMQETLLKAFQHLRDFQGRAKFSTWLVSIASNTGLQILRDRKNVHSLDDEGFDYGEGFRPREIRAWTDDPEELYSKVETRALVERSILGLPAKYRSVLVLRDMEQLPVEEAAAALGLGVPALKARLLRGRLMLREALSPHFTRAAKGGAA